MLTLTQETVPPNDSIGVRGPRSPLQVEDFVSSDQRRRFHAQAGSPRLQVTCLGLKV